MRYSKVLFVVLFSGLLGLSSYQLCAVDSHIMVSSFHSSVGSYGEIHIFINGNSVEREFSDSIIASSSVDVTLIVTKDESDVIVYGDRFRLHGPVSEIVEDFYDLRRFPIENGNYSLEYEITDSYNTDNIKKGDIEFSVNFQPEKVQFSSVQLLFSAEPDDNPESRFVKNGYRFEIAPLNYFPPGVDQMFFYSELYGLTSFFDRVGEEFYALGIELRRRGSKDPVFSTYRRRGVIDPDIILRSLDISDLGSGEYVLKLSAVNRDREVIASQKVLFFRHNPIQDHELVEEQLVTFETSFVQELDNDELVYALKALTPVVMQNQTDRLNHILRKSDRTEMQYFLFEQWCIIDPYNPENSYEQYMEVARAVDRMFFSGFGHGFETDRGRIFLKYGRPNDMENVQTETDAPPYEIWTYNILPGTGQTNVQFVFYNPSLAGNMYELLHTNARGELNNPNWIRDLYRNAPAIHEGPTYHQIDGVKDGFNRRAVDIFRDNK